MPKYYERLRPRKSLFLWGVGIDTPATSAIPKDFADRCALIGSRDYGGASIDGQKVVFCPCASAMNRAFDISRPRPVHKVVCYLHHNKPIDPPDLFAAYPTMNNYGDFTETLDFLASGKIVITNSYHGMYWATLLGRKVICLEGGGKFAHFKWTPAFSKAADHKNALAHADSIPAYPDALGECRSLNMSFYQKVMSIMAG